MRKRACTQYVYELLLLDDSISRSFCGTAPPNWSSLRGSHLAVFIQNEAAHLKHNDGWSICRVGFAPTRKHRLCTVHTRSGPWSMSALGQVNSLPTVAVEDFFYRLASSFFILASIAVFCMK